MLVEYVDGNFSLLTDKDYIESAMITAALKVNATIVGAFFHKFSPTGVSGVVVIAESHFSIHTWPEEGYAAVDFYTCGDLDSSAAIGYLESALCATAAVVQRVDRGHPSGLI